MSAWKQFTTKDVTITSFTADKGFTLNGDEFTNPEIGVNIFSGRNAPFSSQIDSSTGLGPTSFLSTIYSSAKQLYYSNYLSSSMGDDAVTASIIPGVTPEYDVLQGGVEAPIYDNYLQSSLLQSRYWPTGSNDHITTISIPTKLYGEKIIPSTFELEYTGSNIFTSGLLLTDDGEGNIISGSDVVGQIFYSHGIAVLTTHSCELLGDETDTDARELEGINLSFSSSLTIYEQQYKCTISENEFGSSLNPTLLDINSSNDDTFLLQESNGFIQQENGGNLIVIVGDDGEIIEYNTSYLNFVTSSYFEPYVTCVGLYNENKELMAVGKLSFPLPISQFTDTTVMINFDI